MNTAPINALLVGRDFRPGHALAVRLEQLGFRCCFADTLLAASQAWRAQPAGLVLSEMRLPDGNGFGLALSLAGRAVTAFVCVPVEDGCYWLRAVDRGRRCRWAVALRPAEFARALEGLARNRVSERGSFKEENDETKVGSTHA